MKIYFYVIALFSLTFLSCNDSGASTGTSISSNSLEPSSSSSESLTFTDARDGQIYRYVVIGTQTWMAQNLNYDTLDNGSGSWCYNNDVAKCDIYGRLYDWQLAMGFAYDSYTGNVIAQTNHKGICPDGWHMPSRAEWTRLETYVGGPTISGTKLKANSILWKENTGTDEFGFSALPAGMIQPLSFYNEGISTSWWVAAHYSTDQAYYRYISYDLTVSKSNFSYKSDGRSVRCIKN